MPDGVRVEQAAVAEAEIARVVEVSGVGDGPAVLDACQHHRLLVEDPEPPDAIDGDRSGRFETGGQRDTAGRVRPDEAVGAEL